ncbi:hypothetical protein LTR56_024181 [Elasticomyces elasticus]|nr:hypothetical protein LTR56_024181 [Elasticomyces elasticus]KAK3640574.1 hypothetical protein LTR22_016950 [Elasticomyces elasticus]KAK4910206.1 hypothetical protein LTR49_021097 [Elasticomyces elasticus]KAK5759964.1 hypothetical protein LTS12_009860 [Elasticomyces elasticus]
MLARLTDLLQDASRFLQQSTTRLSFSHQDPPNNSNHRQPSRAPSRNPRYAQRPPGMNPYHQPSASQARFPFASRYSRGTDPSQAPLFYSTTEDFPHDDEEEEHDRDVADAWALQRSRQHFGPSNLTESSEMEDDGLEQIGEGEGQRHDRDESPEAYRGRRGQTARVPVSRDGSIPESEVSSKGKGRLVDVNLASTINEESLVTLPPPSDDPPTPFQTFRTTAKDPRQSTFMPFETDSEANIAMPRPPSTDMRESIPPTVILPAQEPPKHDGFWASLFQISLFALFATFVLIWFHTSTPTSKNPLGDTIYSALRGSTNMLLWDTFVSILVALLWLALLRNYIRVLIFAVLIAVPITLTTFSLYPLIASFKGSYHGSSTQDKAMRYLSAIPAIIAVVWTWQVIVSRHSLTKAIAILEFSTSKVLASSPHLVTLGFATLATVVLWTWAWMLMFERLFLSGHFSLTGGKRFVLDANSWWLGAFFILQYLWTLSVIAGVQRATTAATVSQWYFHRLTLPQPSSLEVVRASLGHAVGTGFGTVCLGTFLALLVRLPLIILPGRVSGVLGMCVYWCVPSGLRSLTDPLTLTYAAIHSQPLGIAARGLGMLRFVDGEGGRNGMGGRRGYSGGGGGSGIVPYRLAKLLLQATRYIMSFALGMAGWVRTAHSLKVEGGAGVRGSLYAYVVGLIAGTIGFAVLGAVENVVGGVVDAVVICWASETGGGRGGEARFCREAGELFGEDGGERGGEEGRGRW